MGKASDWLREERRKTLGDWVAFCLGCGHAQRYFEEDEASLPSACPACGGRVAAPLPRLRRALQLGLRRRVRGLRGRAAPGRPPGRADPQTEPR